MKLNSLTPVPGSTKNRKRVGRGHGSGLGKSAGRGDKGAGQRSGFKRRPWFEGGQMPLARRLPRRGFTNIFKKEFQIVNLNALGDLGIEKIDAQIMFQKGLVRSALKPIKILGDGELNMKLEVTASAFSTSAKEKIEKAGGTVTVQ
ncbi:MAG: 50S ribosomal protein L15 [Candidatus Marinimicrobia bacterium]|jgi:large subunit ribosomal protein L15|nr:50S ribosomal protein L15 [Candidatus Neomarinimicrobiota bacterium]MDP6821477.1 50S ribosomal protein L15 [Candidatus Neomarinimicrobiota bacterium]MDP6861100.1 50S ribosomal protein L15 [Candidatus Neomarinimicrobiota bacterium]MEC7730254.1 50S ribosomal protein L15 [Candidatus Neomarinimicrobiota bacterium]MEC8899357.1 50S ribosomal protein L15 [Candidatus Neomarinimicrobiota bacterium]